MYRWPLIILAAAFLAAPVYGQMTGTVSGTVTDTLGNPVDEALVRLTDEGWHGGGGHGGGHNCGGNYSTFTGTDGTFLIEDVDAGDYTAFASKMGYGHDSEEIEVSANQNTVVDFVLAMGGHGGGGYCGDSLEIVELSGWAIVEEDSFYTHYYLDTDNDGTADYRLAFGPEWYDPGSGATRPNDGDSIWVVGGLMGYSTPQTVVVYEINGLFWREPGQGHGGHGGHGGNGGCNPDSLELIETAGFAILEEMPMHPDWFMYFLDENNDGEAEYHLNFGAPWYDPGNGATRPEEGDSVDIVGGLMDGCNNLPTIIVYEINGMFWREPGDTSYLWLESPTSVFDDRSELPSQYLAATSYPNPFNPSATISFELPQAQNVRVSVYDILGREVAVLANGLFPAGENQVQFNSADYSNVSSAVFFYRVETASAYASGKMILLK
jgi:hypothetical protein